jgi:hypothetical protein
MLARAAGRDCKAVVYVMQAVGTAWTVQQHAGTHHLWPLVLQHGLQWPQMLEHTEGKVISASMLALSTSE